uniref:ribosome modulation factor n=1 Tax=Massilia aurea TaxID=373040 RepID=UPI00351D20AC
MQPGRVHQRRQATDQRAGYNACYFGGAARTSCPYGEDDAQMRQAWIEGWQEADADCWASANAA